MAPRKRVIIDTDPGVDDTLAMLLAFSSSPEELEVPLISINFGNVDAFSCLRNVVALFHVIGKERTWRQANKLKDNFKMVDVRQPLVAIGADEPLGGQEIISDSFHGVDGLGGVHTSHPHLAPSANWRELFNLPKSDPDAAKIAPTPIEAGHDPSASLRKESIAAAAMEHKLFRPCMLPAHREMLHVLRDNPPQTITIVALGPMTNIALAASEDLETFLRVKEVVVMGGALAVPGNVTPFAEFNAHSDAIAMARIMALTSPTPNSTLPPIPPDTLRPYPTPLPGPRLLLTLLPLDITGQHVLAPAAFEAAIASAKSKGSPLADWASGFLGPALKRGESYGAPGLAMHDPLCIWYCITHPDHANDIAATEKETGREWVVAGEQDVRTEVSGQWTRGMSLVDRRGRPRLSKGDRRELDVTGAVGGKIGDRGSWLREEEGNRVRVAVKSPGEKEMVQGLLRRIFGGVDE